MSVLWNTQEKQFSLQLTKIVSALTWGQRPSLSLTDNLPWTEIIKHLQMRRVNLINLVFTGCCQKSHHCLFCSPSTRYFQVHVLQLYTWGELGHTDLPENEASPKKKEQTLFSSSWISSRPRVTMWLHKCCCWQRVAGSGNTRSCSSPHSCQLKMRNHISKRDFKSTQTASEIWFENFRGTSA